MEKIDGGYYIKARKIQMSEIAHCAPAVREIWDWILLQANHKDNNVCKRGQTIRSYKDIIEGLSWYVGWRKMGYSKSDCENAMKRLKKAGMITTQKTTRGMIINVVNYERYQNPTNYESHTEKQLNATRKPQSSHTINKNEKNDKKENAAETADSIPFSFEDYLKKMSKDPRKHIRVIAVYFYNKGSHFDSEKEVRAAISRHSKDAVKVLDFGKEKVMEAMRLCVEEELKDPIGWTLGTVFKRLTK